MSQVLTSVQWEGGEGSLAVVAVEIPSLDSEAWHSQRCMYNIIECHERALWLALLTRISGKTERLFALDWCVLKSVSCEYKCL